MRNNILDKRVPQGLGALLLVVSLITITWLSGNAILFGTKAAVGNIPRNVQISNISDTSFTVSYITDEKEPGTIAYGTTAQLGRVGLDDQDKKTGSAVPHRVHHITLTNLTPSTRYFFSILSGGGTFSLNNKPYEVMTAPVSSMKQPTLSPVVGQVSLESGGYPTEAIAYISSDTLQLLSALLKPDGSYLIPLLGARNRDLSPVTITSSTLLHMTIVDATMTSNITLRASQGNPVPIITLSKSYDFSISNLPLTPSPNASSSAKPLGFPTIDDRIRVQSPQIFTPKKEEKFKDQQPMFKGKGLPNTEVEIIIHSKQEIRAIVRTDASGNWEYRPNTPLDPGTHTITISSLDISGILQSLSQSFTVYAQGGQFTEPSISPTPTTPPAASASATPTVNPNLYLTLTAGAATPTIDPNSFLTLTAAAGQNASRTPTSLTQPPLPDSGDSSAILGMGAIVFFVIVGAVIFIGGVL